VAKFPEPAAIVSDLKTVSRSEGATPGRIGQHGQTLMQLPMVTTQMKKLGFELSNQNRASATRQVLLCSLDSPAVGTINRMILKWTLNFEGSGEKLDRRRTLAMEELRILSRATFDLREADAVDILTAFLVSTTESPCRFGGQLTNTEALFKLKAQVILELRAELLRETAEDLARRLTFEPRRDVREPVVEELLARFPRAADVAAQFIDGHPEDHICALLKGAYAHAISAQDRDDQHLSVAELRLSGTDRERKTVWRSWSARNGYDAATERRRSFLEYRYLQSRDWALRETIREAVKIEAADQAADGKAWRRALGIDPSGDRTLA